MTDEDKQIFYVFVNSKNAKLYGLTNDKEGTSFPEDQGKWRYHKEFEGGLQGRIVFGLENEKAAHEAIEKQGYYIWEWSRLLKAVRP